MNSSIKPYVIHWFRRDLRLEDNTALNEALAQEYPVKCIFIFDKEILDELPPNDRRLTFIYETLKELRKQLQCFGSDLSIYNGKVEDVWKQIATDNLLEGVFVNRDYEPYAIGRDAKVKNLLAERGISLHTAKDQVIFEKDEILTQTARPYSVYTPYSRAWKKRLQSIEFSKTTRKEDSFLQYKEREFLSLAQIGFSEEKSCIDIPSKKLLPLAEDYAISRDFPAKDSTSHISTALRFGTLSIRSVVKYAQETNETFLNELIWREFFMQILWHYPQVVTQSFRKKYDAICWRNNEQEFTLWCQGNTGYPMVDAGMRELNETGYMHNRVRMITASFLVKHLLIDWRWGEAYFAKKLLDYDLASNNGNWQWVTGTGTDAAPYFRIFNPEAQQKKFDKDLDYIKKWVPEYGTVQYLTPIVKHEKARERCLAAYKAALK